jgi:very-short-patch-repair endonuclease
MKTIYCEKCSKEYKSHNYYNHRCLKNRSKFYILEEWKNNDNNLYKCPECECEFSKMGLVGHYYRKHDERGIKKIENNKKEKKNIIKLTKEEKSKILSDAKKKSFMEGKSKGWFHINSDKNRRSYPEKFFIKVFDDNDIFNKYTIEEKFTYGKYTIDFLIVELKLIIEIDGQQHFRTEEAINHDKIRDIYFLNEGFKIYRIKWLDVCKDAKGEINQLIDFINNIDNEIIRRYSLEDFEKKCKCGNIIKSSKSKICNTCRIFNNRKIKNRPPVDVLVNEVKEFGYCETGRKYGVSDNCIRKWIKIGVT